MKNSKLSSVKQGWKDFTREETRVTFGPTAATQMYEQMDRDGDFTAHPQFPKLEEARFYSIQVGKTKEKAREPLKTCAV